MQSTKHLPAFSKLYSCCFLMLQSWALATNSVITLHLYGFHPYIPLCMLWIPPVGSSILNQFAKAPQLKREERLRVATVSLICAEGICCFSVSSFEGINQQRPTNLLSSLYIREVALRSLLE